MKNLLALIVVLFAAATVTAQDGQSGPGRRLVLKFNPVNYALQSYSFEAEGMLNRKNSLVVGVGIPNNQSLLNKYGIEPSEDLTKLNFSTMHLRAAFRHYSGNSGLPRGFYIEPYLKYQQLKADATIVIDDEDISENASLRSAVAAVGTPGPTSVSADMKANFNTLNVGFQMGVQMLIAKRISLDLYFLGLEGGVLNGSLKGTPDPAVATPQDIQDMEDEINEGIDGLPGFLKDKLTVTSDDTSVEVKAKQLPYPWLRGGISIGIAF